MLSALSETVEHADASLIGSLLLLGKTTRALMGLKLAAIGLCSGQDELLLAISARGGGSVSDLAELVSVRPSTVSKMLDRLTASGLVERLHSESDKRQTLVTLTKNGQEMIARIREVHTRIDRELADHLPSGESTSCVKDIAELTAVVESRLRRLR